MSDLSEYFLSASLYLMRFLSNYFDHLLFIVVVRVTATVPMKTYLRDVRRSLTSDSTEQQRRRRRRLETATVFVELHRVILTTFSAWLAFVGP